MSKLDKIKEYIGALKVYLSIIVAMIMAIGAGEVKLLTENQVGLIFYSGLVSLMLLIISFLLIAYRMHKKIDELEEL